jgi:hypothetical protein
MARFIIKITEQLAAGRPAPGRVRTQLPAYDSTRPMKPARNRKTIWTRTFVPA